MRVIFIYSGLWVAVCGFGLALSTYATTNAPIDFIYCAFCFCAAYFVYSLDRLLTGLSPEDRLNRPGQSEWQDKNRVLLRVVLVAVGLAGPVLFFFLKPSVLPYLAFFAGLALLYLIPLGAGPGARFRAGLKPFLLAAVWIGGVVWIPLVGEREGRGAEPYDYYLAIIRFALFSANCILFDVLDYRGDRSHGKATFAARHGRTVAIRLAMACLLLCMLMVCGWSIHGDDPAEARELIPPLVFLIIAWNTRGLLRRAELRPFLPAILDGLLLLPLVVHGVYVWSMS